MSGAGLRIGSLFSGVGGLDLGLEWAGVGRPAWFAECEPYPAGILARRWPGVPVVADVRDVTPATCGPIDVLVGGFPCQDISLAGKGAGLAGERSGLFFEMMRVAREFMPGFIVFENVGAAVSRVLDAVLAEVDAAGYDAAWSTFGADAVGAPHRRLRWWCVAWRKGEGYPPPSGTTWGMAGASGTPPSHGVMVGGRIMRAAPWAEGTKAPPAWPTPAKWDGRQGRIAPSQFKRKAPGLALAVAADFSGHPQGTIPASLAAQAADAWHSAGAVLNAAWVEALMGFPLDWTHATRPVGHRTHWPVGPGPQPEHEPPRVVVDGLGAVEGDEVMVRPDYAPEEWEWDGAQCYGRVAYVNGDSLDVELPSGDIEPFDYECVVESPRQHMARVQALGNAVVPQCAEVVGRVLLAVAGVPS